VPLENREDVYRYEQRESARRLFEME
jgi:hypothetical protein